MEGQSPRQGPSPPSTMLKLGEPGLVASPLSLSEQQGHSTTMRPVSLLLSAGGEFVP